MNEQILFDARDRVKAQQMAMARNISKLTTKTAQKRQAHLLCESLKQSIRARA
ncbi:hypothetical protein C7440_1037 [Pusillimonas noertemannii]|uniref:Uncharacterized protein n=1 Tax=Pusillimonas noertemannii TaxID=305977 RepID=A0A2U1CRW3_9BURK|nr:hypothetical protein C7440_1037 [Pusillimonas noertemannii]